MDQPIREVLRRPSEPADVTGKVAASAQIPDLRIDEGLHAE